MARWSIVLLLVLPLGCAPTLPTGVRLTSAVSEVRNDSATVTFFWQEGSCDPSGHYVIASDRGGVVAKITRGHRAVVPLTPGEHVFWTWNPSREGQMGHVSPTDVALARVRAEAGQRYFVQLAFGEWGDSGPRSVQTMYRGRIATIARRCVGSEVALLAIGASDSSFLAAERAAAALPALALEGDGGHDPDDLQEHRGLAEARFARLSREGRDLSTVEPAPK